MSDSALEHFDIQAMLRGFGTTWPWSVFLYGTFAADNPKVNRKFLREVATALGGGAPTSVSELDQRGADPDFHDPFNVAFAYPGLSKLGIAADVRGSFAPEFTQGMRVRAAKNSDLGRSAPECWEPWWRDGTVDFWISVYARSSDEQERQREILEDQLRRHGLCAAGWDMPNVCFSDDTEVWIDDPERQPGPRKALEHFGFEDGIGNPPVKGLAPAGLAGTFAGGKRDKAGQWRPIAAGEFLYGHLDEIGEIPPGPPPGIAANGTYMVLRKLSQDVDTFRDYLHEWAEHHDTLADALAEKLVGRTRNGQPLVAGPPLGDRNDFVYAGDGQGKICPLGSHVRRANPRDTLNFGTLLVDRHRILRRGIPYGTLVPRDKKQADVNPMADANDGEKPYPGQGLLFIALNIDIRRQFEFIQSQWVNQGNDLNQGTDKDPIVGSHRPGHPVHNRIVLLTGAEQAVAVCPDIPAFVETRGGGYFFLPGVRAYQSVLEGHLSPG
jgi:Dyp-type peroxidase family